MIRRIPLDAHAAPRLQTQSRLRGRVRPGTSLLEVLVGLGIMAVGAIGAFVLFPLSAINVSRALIDDRTTTCAVTADGQLRDIHRNGGQFEPYAGVLDMPQVTPTANDNGLRPDEPSLPVVVDPMGIVAGRNNVGNGGTGGTPPGTTQVQRVTLNVVNNSTNSRQLALRFCSQMDGLTFNEGGKVSDATDPNFSPATMRELRYNWMWVLQRPVQRDKTVTRMQVVVYDKRVHLYPAPNSEAVFAAAFVPGTSEITGVSAAAEVRKGMWVMDATVGTDANGRGVRHAEFYRVTGVTENPLNGTLTLEVHKPVARADGRVDRGNPAAERYTGLLVLLPAAADVFERPVLTTNTP